MPRTRVFWASLSLAFASSLAAAVCFTVAYYERQARFSLDDVRTFLTSLPPTSDNEQTFIDIADADANALPWWIAGGVCAALAVTFLALAVLRRPRSI